MKNKKLVLLTVILTVVSNMLFAQGNYTKEVEYATITVNFFYQGNQLIYDDKGLHRSPLIYMPDGTIGLMYNNSPEEYEMGKALVSFKTLNEILNYMASYNWKLVSNESMPFLGGGGTDSKSSIINTNEYIVILNFERKTDK